MIRFFKICQENKVITKLHMYKRHEYVLKLFYEFLNFCKYKNRFFCMRKGKLIGNIKIFRHYELKGIFKDHA